MFGLVGVEVIEDDVDLPGRVLGNQIVHEVKELAAPAAVIVPGFDLAGGNLERGKERRGAVPLVGVREPHHGPADLTP